MAGKRRGGADEVLGEIDPLGRGRRIPPLRTGTTANAMGRGGRSGWRSYLGSGVGCRSAVASAPRRFAVLRVAKIKTLGNLRSSAKHTFRQRETPNADPELKSANEVWIGPDDADGVAAAWAARAPEQIRKNAVHALEYLVTASPEALGAMSKDDRDAYFATGLDWLCRRHGEENVLSAVIHRDETTPHLTAMVIPLDERGHLNARSFTGGKVMLSEMQTSFAEVVADWGIERGLHRSNARHVSIREYYAQVNTRPAESLDLPEPDRGNFWTRGRETPESYAERLREVAGAQYDHLQRNYDKRLQEASEALFAAERGASRTRIVAAARGMALEALSAWDKIAGVEDDAEYHDLLGRFAAQWETSYPLLARNEPKVAAEMEKRLFEAGIETGHVQELRLQREQDIDRKVGREGRSLDDDEDGWGL